ncbi:resolvase [Mycolicibacterium fortuitum]|nr:resolvase [Mycolicibacterium fortuitum]
MRALIVTRLSRVTEATTSPERQLEECRDYCERRGWEVVDVAEDLDVSGAVDPFDRKKRPNLARWLAGEAEQFDVIVAYRVDRLTRSIRQLQRLVNWAEDNGKLVVSATESHFDMTSPFAAVLIALIGTVAEMELEAISERNASSQRFRVSKGHYRGSTPPWGYKPQQDVEGTWRLVQDDEQTKVIHEVVARVVGQEPLQRIARDLTARGVPTVKDRVAQLQGKPMKGTAWNVTPLRRSLTSDSMLGYATKADGSAVRGDDGAPVIRATPILDRQTLEQLRAELDSRKRRGEPTKRSSSLLLRVVHCGKCDQPAYQFNGGSHSKTPRYRCRSVSNTKTGSCGNTTLRMDYADSTVEQLLLALLGNSERLERVWDSGSDNSVELADISAELIDVTGLIGSPAYRPGTPQRAALDARIAALAARQEVLSAEEIKPSGWTWQSTGEKFSAWWERQDVTARNTWMRSMGVRLSWVGKHLDFELGEVFKMAQELKAVGPFAEINDLLTNMKANGIQGIELDENHNIMRVEPYASGGE